MEKEPKSTNKSSKSTNKSSNRTDISSKKTDKTPVESGHPGLQNAAADSHTSTKLVAVISAAIATARGKAATDLRIADLRQVGPVTSKVGSGVPKVSPVVPQPDLWAMVGRIEAINSRQIFFERKGK